MYADTGGGVESRSKGAVMELMRAVAAESVDITDAHAKAQLHIGRRCCMLGHVVILPPDPTNKLQYHLIVPGCT